MITKAIDSKGRLMLGNSFANRLVLVDDADPGRIVVTLAEAVPAREAWLYKNQGALHSVRRGLEQAQAGHLAEGPDLDADAHLIADSEDK